MQSTVTSGSAARILGVSMTTLESWVCRGLLHPTRVMNGWRYFSTLEIYRLANRRARRYAGTCEVKNEKIPANARLIDSAPELLAALKGVMSEAPRQGTKWPMPDKWAAAYAAIAKAEGVSNDK